MPIVSHLELAKAFPVAPQYHQLVSSIHKTLLPATFTDQLKKKKTCKTKEQHYKYNCNPNDAIKKYLTGATWKELCSATDTRKNVAHTESDWNYTQGQCLNYSLLASLYSFQHTLLTMLYLYLLFSTTVYYPNPRVAERIVFLLHFNKHFSCFSHWRTRETTTKWSAVKHWLICNNSHLCSKDK